jgi:uncharacterized protein YbjQ (UPF0145 family)
MKLTIAALALPIALFVSGPANADDAVGNYSIASVVARPEYAAQLEGVQFYFGSTRHPAGRTIEADAQTSLRTRKLGRSDEEACQWVMLSALIQLRNYAQSVGGDAVVNVRSNWRNNVVSSTTEYQCASGFLMAGVALKGDVISIR